MLSVKHIPLPRVQSVLLLRSLFPKKFFVGGAPTPKAAEAEDATDQQCFLVGLPPQNHLLLRCHIREASSHIFVATDAWTCLSFLEAELQAQLDSYKSAG